jgi:dihydroxyacid dehydratase/phosphogluconate dehydratase
MPQISIPEAIDDTVIRANCIIATDGRVAFGSDTTSIVHIVPEAIEGGGLAGVRTGDWVYLNMRKGEFQIVTSTRGGVGFRVVSEKEIVRRSEVPRRVHELERRRRAFLPSVRSILDNVSSAAEGVSPLTN